MPKYGSGGMSGGNITFGVDFKVDSSNLNKIKSELQNIQKLTVKDYTGKDISKAAQDLVKVKDAARDVEKALNKAFNTNLGTLNVSKFNQELQGLNIDKLYQQFSNFGAVGQKAFTQIAAQALTTNVQLKQTTSLLDKMGTTLMNSLKWNIASSAINSVSGAIQRSFGYIKSLDSSLNDIRIVTGKSAEDMANFAVQANKAAAAIGQTTTAYTDAALIYYQQGLNEDQANTLAETTLKVANITGQATDTVSDEITAVMNGYQLGANQVEGAFDSLAAVAATTASDLEEISTGMSKVASTANMMGVPLDSLNAQLATIVSVTRQAPESVGTALKTIYARMGDLKMGKTDEDGVSLGDVSGQMEDAGVQILDATGNLRDMGDVINDVAAKWNTWTEAQRIAMAEAMAGKRQYNNLIALFDNWDMYTQALNTSMEAQGTIEEQNSVYMDSLKAHTQQLTAAQEDLIDSFANSDSFKDVIDGATTVISLLADLVDGIGGGGNALLALGSIAGNVFSKQIAQEINSFVMNIQNAKYNTEQLNAAIANTQAWGKSQGIMEGSPAIKMMVEAQTETQKYYSVMSEGQINEQNERIRNLGLAQQEVDTLKAKNAAALEFANKIAGTSESNLSIFQEENASAEQLNNAYYNLQESIKTVNEALNDFKDDPATMQELANAIQQFGQALGMSQPEIDALKTKISTASANTSQMGTAVRAVESAISNARAQMENFDQASTKGASALDQASAKAESFKTSIDAANASAKQLWDIKTTVQFISAIGQVTMAVQGLINIVDVFNDDSLSTGEKVRQIILSLTMSIPMLITGFNTVSTTIKTFAAQSIASMLGITDAEMIAKLGTMSLGDAFMVMGAKLWTALAPILPIILAVAAAVAGVTAAVYLGIKAWNKDADAAREAAEAEKNAKEAADDATEAYNKLADTFDRYDNGIKKLDELTKGTQEYKDALIDANKSAIELIKTNSDLANKASRDANGVLRFYNDDGTEMSRDQVLEEAQTGMVDAQAAANIASIQSNEAHLKSERTNTIRSENLGYAQSTGDSTMWVQLSDDQMQAIINAYNESGALTKEDLDKIPALNNNNELINSLLDSNGNLKDSIINLADETNSLNQTNKLLLDDSLRKELDKNKDYKYTNEVDENGNKIERSEAAKNAIANVYGAGLTDDKIQKIKDKAHKTWYKDEAFGGGNEDTVHEEYAKARGWTLTKDRVGDTADFIDAEGTEHQKVSDDAQRAYLEQLEIAKNLANYNEKNLNTIIADVDTIQSKLSEQFDNDTVGQMLGFLSNPDANIDVSKISAQQAKALNEALKDDSDLNKTLEDSLSKIDWSTLGYDSADAYLEAIKTALPPDFEQQIPDKLKESIVSVSESTADLISGIQTGDITSDNIADNDKYKALQEQLENIKDLYPELTGDIEILNDTALVGSEEYIDALSRIKDTMDQLQIEQLNQDFQDAFDEIQDYERHGGIDIPVGIDLDAEDFEDNLDKILDADYAINIEVHTDAEEAFDSITNAYDNISDAASKIGENYVVAANDIRELNNVFPGIIENMQAVGDGSVQLSQSVVQNAIAAAEGEAQADAQSTVDKLQNQANLLRAKQAAYQQMADAASTLATTESKTDENAAQARSTISTQLTEIKNLNSQLASQQEIDNSQETANASNTNGQITAQNWNSAFQSAAQSSAEFAQTAIANMNAVANGGGAISTGDFGVNYSGRNGQSSEASKLEALEKDIESSKDIDWAKQATQFQQYADSAGKAANDIEGMIAQIGASTIELDKTFDNVSLGKGASPSKSKSGGGGGKDNTDDSQKDYIDSMEEEIDRYHDINEELDDIERAIKKISRQEDKLFGDALIENLQEQNEELGVQIEKLREKQDIERQEAAELQAYLKAQGVAFDSGKIVNYTAALAAAQAKVNALIAQYNNLITDYNTSLDKTYKEGLSKQIDAMKDQVDDAKDAYDELQKKMDRYDEVQNEIQDNEEAIQDAIDEQIENSIKSFKVHIDIELDLAEAERDWNEFRKKVIDKIKDDDYLGQARARMMDFDSYYGNNQADGRGEIQELTDHVNATKAELQEIEQTGWSDVYGDNAKQALDDLKDYTDKLMTALEDVQEIEKDIHEDYLDTIDKTADAFEDQANAYEQLDKIIEHDMNLMKIVRPRDYQAQEVWYNKRHENNMQQIDFYRKEADAWKQRMDAAEKGSDEWKKFRDNWMDSVNSMNEAVENSVQNLLDKYEAAVDDIVQRAKDKLAGGSWNDMTSEWDKAKWTNDRYLDDLTRANSVSKFMTDANSAMNGMTPKQQQEMLKFMNNEISNLESLTQLRQIDVDIANKKLEIMKAQMALEDAEQAKTSMRLRRDSQGNYTYQYVADDDAVASKQQELRDLIEELRQVEADDLTNTVDEAYDKISEYYDKYRELATTYADDHEKLNEEIAKLDEQYWGPEGYLTQLGVDYQAMQSELMNTTGTEYAQFLKDFGDQTRAMLGLGDEPEDDSIWQSIQDLMGDDGKIPSLLDSFVNDRFAHNFADNLTAEARNMMLGEQGISTLWDTAMANMANQVDWIKNDVILPANDEIMQANADYQRGLDETQQIAGQDFDLIAEGIDYAYDETEQLIESNDTLIDSYMNEIDAVAEAYAEIQALVDQYREAEQAAIDAAAAARDYWAALQEGTGLGGGGITGSSGGDDSNSGGGGGGGTPSTGSSGGGSNGSGEKKASDSDIEAIAGNIWTYGSWGNNPTRHALMKQKFGDAEGDRVYNAVQAKFNSGYGYKGGLQHDRAYYKNYGPSAFATGGYTGEWAGGGRLAFLHQKEMVLNADDTKNALAAMKISNAIINSLSGVDSTAIDSILAGRDVGRFVPSQTDEGAAAQTVTINADFPNAHDAQEIKDALNNLVARASQVANGNRRTY